MPLTKEELDYFKKKLLVEKNRLLKSAGAIEETAMKSTIKDASGDNSSYSFHMADQGTDTYEREMSSVLASREYEYLQEIEQALERINNGSYGICLITGKEIPKERLEVVPTAKYRVEAKLSLNRQRAQ